MNLRLLQMASIIRCASGKQSSSKASSPLPRAAAQAPGERRSPKTPTMNIQSAGDIARAEWDASPALQSEFGEFRRYLAYTEATSRGVARVFAPGLK